MPPVTNFVVLSGQNTSTGMYVERCDRGLVVEVPSHGAGWGLVQLAFTTAPGSEGGASSSSTYGVAWPAAQTSAFVFAGAGPGYGIPVEYAPSPWVRVQCTGSVSITASFAVHAIATQ
jgi:hypothetical protein